MDPLLWSSAGLGFVLGLRHALDPDHVLAVTTVVGRQRGFWRSSLVGSFWGLGHAASLFVAGGAILALKLSVPPAVAAGLESLVAVMLIALGALAVRTALRGLDLHLHRHEHDGREHLHVHGHVKGAPHLHRHRHLLAGGLRPFLVGVVHGLAGSAGLSLLVLGSAASPAAGFSYLLALGVGSLCGMLLLSSLLSLPLALLQSRYATLHLRFQLLAGVCSLAFGVWLFGHLAASVS